MKRTVRLFLVAMLVFSMMVTCCGCKETNTDGKDVVVSPVVEPSKEETKETAETVETEKPAETVEPVATEEPAEPEEPVELTGDYLKELAQEEIWEFKLSDYNADFVAGNLVTITMVLESAGEFNGTLGTCIGTAYTWEQTEFSSEAGEYTVEWKIQPSVDMAQLGLWYAENGSVGVKSVDVVIEEVEVALEGDYIKVLQMGDNWEMTLSDYNAEYQVGDFVNIEITMESDGDFNGAVGACVGKDYAWQQKEYKYDAAGTYTFSWKVKPSTDMAQIGVWWTGGTGVGITKVKVTIEEQPIGISGDFIELFTEQGYYEFSPYAVSDYIFKFGDTIKVTVELESDGAFNGCMATCVGDNYAWEQVEMNGETGTTTWTMTVAPTADLIQIAVWWIDGTAVGIKDIKIDMVKWGYQHKNVVGDIYTSTSTDNDYTFKPSDYCDFNDGDIITIEVGLDSNDIYNGCVRMTDVNGVSRSANFESRGTAIATLVLQANKDTEATIDFWWMNTKVALNTIKVYVGGELPKVEPGVFEYSSTQVFPLTDYVDYKAGDTLKITATLSSDGEFNGALAASSLDAANGYWDQEGFESKDGSAVTCTFILEQAQITDLNVMVWWVAGSKVVVDPKAITVEVIESGSDSGEDTTEPDEDTDVDVDRGEPDATLVYDSNWVNNVFSYDMADYYDDLVAGDVMKITVTVNSEATGWNGGIGANDADTLNDDGTTWKQIKYEGNGTYSLTVTLMEKTGDNGESYLATGGQIQLWYPQTTDYEVDVWIDSVEKVTGEDAGDDATDDDTTDEVVIFEGSKECGNWSASLDLDADNFEGLKFDGTEKLVLTYVSTDTADWGSQFKHSAINPYSEIKACYNVSRATTETTEEIVLTSDYADITTTGLRIEGYNWTITKVVLNAGATSDGGVNEGDDIEDDETGRTPDLCLDSTSYAFDVKTLLPDVKAGDKVLVKVSITTESTGVFNGGIGMHDANTNDNGNTWKSAEYAQAGEHTLEVTLMEKTGDDGNPYLASQGQVQLWWPNTTAGYDVELFVEVTAELVTASEDDGTEGGETEGGETEGGETEGGETEGGETEGGETEGGETEGGETEGGETEGDGTEGGETEGDGTEGGGTEGDGTDTDDTPIYPVWGDNSVTYVGTSGWSEQAITLEQLLGDVDVAMVEKVIISCETANIGAGYGNNTGENNWWSQVSDAKTHELTDINFSNFNMKLVLQATDSQAHKITWEVVEKEIPTVITLFEGNKAATDSSWADYLQIDSTKFAGVKTDGTQKLVITYNSVDTSEWGTQMKVCDGNWTGIKELNLCVSDETTIEWTLTSEFADLLTTGMIVQGWNWNISKIEVMPIEQSNYNCTEAWSGSVTLDGWDKSLSVSKDYFANLSFDGTERVIVTYVSIESSDSAYTSLQYLYDDDGWVKMDGVGYGVLCSATEQRATVTLDSTYADNIKAGGFIIQGHNCTITKVEIVKPNS